MRGKVGFLIMPAITFEQASRHWFHDESAGVLRHCDDIVRANGRLSSTRAGAIAGKLGKLRVGKDLYRAANVAWTLATGQPPAGIVITTNGNNSDLRIGNLKDTGAPPQHSPWPTEGDGAPRRELSRIERALSAEDARAIFEYDPDSGALRWRSTRHNTRGRITAEAGSVVGAGKFDKKGYVVIFFQPPGSDKPTFYFVHRIIWLVVTGQWPDHEIDHRNGVKSDNRRDNLRDVDDTGNSENRRKANKSNKAGLLGVTYDSRTGRYAARIGSGRKLHGLGTFSTPSKAHQAYIEAKRRLHASGTL